MILFDLDPNVVKPGWIPLLITIALGLVMVLLYRSMRRQFRKVDTNFPAPGPAGPPSSAGDQQRSDDADLDASADHPVGDGRAPRP
jgi:hypothetical protein